MRIGFFNANGLSGKLELVLDFMENQELDLIFICETYFLPNQHHRGLGRMFLNLTKPDGRLQSGGRRAIGGIAGYCKPALTNQIRAIHTDEHCNYTILDVAGALVAVGYFPPSMDNRAVPDFLQLVHTLAGEKECVIIGDFNARMGELSGDHHTNGRGYLLRDWLEAAPGIDFNLKRPDHGRFTSFGWGPTHGQGVTDLVFSLNCLVHNLVIHEDNSLGGSDHRPLTFDMAANFNPTREFTRWNVRKFLEPGVIERFQEFLSSTVVDTTNRLERMDVHDVDGMWLLIKNWIETAADGSCGKINFKRIVNRDFWSENLLNMRSQVINQQHRLQEAIRLNLPPRILAGARFVLNRLNSDLRDLLKNRRKELWKEKINDLSSPQKAASFLKMVKCQNSRKNGSRCALDPTKMDEHLNHFRTTFGNPTPPVIDSQPLPFEESDLNKFTSDEVSRILDRAPLGKAAGVDELVGEFFKYGSAQISPLLTVFFNRLYYIRKVPAEWCQTRIVPVFKKGNNQRISNYRPIALTCVSRRLYERLLLPQLNPAVDLLSKFQGGFRKTRSTLDQILSLHEIQVNQAEFHQVFLDLRAAYDTVNRSKLWIKMDEQFGVQANLLEILKNLFDHNYSHLVINGTASESIPNCRGLLQGSSLSPLLFNFYINDLISSLTFLDRVNTLGIQTNCLLFADDANIHSGSLHGLRTLLNACEDWSRRNDMVFAPTKCFYLGPTNMEDMNLLLYGTPLPKVDKADYLGMVFNETGIDFPSNLVKRRNKARNMIQVLGNLGMNSTGWPLKSSTAVYKTFVRPLVEYGLGLNIWSPKVIEEVQKVQNCALRRIFSTSIKTSIKAMEKLLLLEPMVTRNQILHIKLAGRIHNSLDRNIPVVQIWRTRLQHPATNTGSFILNGIKRNPLWRTGNRRNQLFTRLRNIPNSEIQVRDSLVILPDEMKTKIIKAAIMEDNIGHVAAALELQETDRFRKICLPTAELPDRTRNTILRWMTGTVCQHQVCFKCGANLTRIHGIHCSGAAAGILADTDLVQVLVRREPLNEHETVIDQLLNTFRNGNEPMDFYFKIATFIGMIYTACRNMVQQENGYWAPVNERHTPWTHATLFHASEVTGDVVNPHLQARNREIARTRNRPVGRPGLRPPPAGIG
jgi:hypothetical protein